MGTAHVVANDRVAVRRWRSHYLVPADHPSPQRVQALDSALRTHLPGELAARLARTLDPRDTALVFVRRLAFQVAIDAAWDRDAIAAHCARALAATLARELAAGDSENLVRFADRAEYLARFMVDTANGVAARRWYYEEFAGLAALTAGAALRTAAEAEPVTALAALRGLDDAQLVQVVAMLGETGGARVLDAMGSGHSPSRPWGDVLPRLLRAWTQHPPPPGVDTGPQRSLWLMARSDAEPDHALVTAARALAVAITDMDRGTLAMGRDRGEDAVWPWLATAPPAQRDVVSACLGELMRARNLAPDTGDSHPAEDAGGSTPFGGAFLLLDDLFALPLERLCARWPGVAGMAAERAMEILVLAGCNGPGRAAAFVGDPLWRRMFRMDPTVLVDEMAHWLAALGHARRRAFVHGLAPARAGDDDDLACLSMPPRALPREWSRALARASLQVMRAFVARIPGYGASHAAYAQRNFLAATASVEPEPARIVVRLTRPPLALMLNFAGLNRGERHWTALDARPFALFTES
jgi:hypothetical protein